MNKLIVTGNLTRNMDITYLQNGITMGKNTIVSNKHYKKMAIQKQSHVLSILLFLVKLPKS